LEQNPRLPVTLTTPPVFTKSFPVPPGFNKAMPLLLKPLVFTLITPLLVSAPKLAAAIGKV